MTPTGDDMFVIRPSEGGAPGGEAVDFSEALAASQRYEAEGDFEKACNTRLRACQTLVELIPDEGGITLDWEDEQTQAALTAAYFSGIDHFLLGDWEMAAAIFEMLLEIDPEDHLEATVILAYTYLAMGEHDSFDDIVNDVSDKYPDKAILALWSHFERKGSMDAGELARFRRQFSPYYEEFTAEEHPVSEEYLADIRGERPSHQAQARELWLRTEHLWAQRPQFIEALKKTK